MYQPEDFEIEGEALNVRLPADRGIRVSIHLTEAETVVLLDLAEARGVSLANAAHDVLVGALKAGSGTGQGAAGQRQP